MQAALLASEPSIEGRLRPFDVLIRAKLDLVVAQHPKNFHHLLEYWSVALTSGFAAGNQRVRTNVLGNHILMSAVTLSSDPD